MNSVSKLRVCQFCKSPGLGVLCFPSGDNAYAVKCRKCGAQGPIVASQVEAEKLWNAAFPRQPNYDVLDGKLLSQLNEEEKSDARELWLRQNVDWLRDREFVHFLLLRLDEARG